MPAFNYRFEPKEIAGVPLMAIVGGVVFVVFLSLTILFPGLIKVVTLLVSLIGLATLVFFSAIGSELPFLMVRIKAMAEKNDKLFGDYE